VAAAYFAWSRVKVYREYRARELAAAAAKID
jgi:hypothetical protein